MVRLKVYYGLIAYFDNYYFQFQNGAIKSLSVTCLKLIAQTFNSKMVRLKDEHLQGVYRCSSAFNSKMVRLKARRKVGVRRAKPAFNSKMVRLKDGFAKSLIVKLLAFNSKMVRLKGDA